MYVCTSSLQDADSLKSEAGNVVGGVQFSLATRESAPLLWSGSDFIVTRTRRQIRRSPRFGETTPLSDYTTVTLI